MEERKKFDALLRAIENLEGVPTPWNIAKPLSSVYRDLEDFVGRERVIP
jgi:hypothetical protein